MIDRKIFIASRLKSSPSRRHATVNLITVLEIRNNDIARCDTTYYERYRAIGYERQRTIVFQLVRNERFPINSLEMVQLMRIVFYYVYYIYCTILRSF